MRVNVPWVKSWKGAMLLLVLVIVVALVALHSLGAGSGIPPDQIETIAVRHENESSFNVGPSTDEGSRLLSKCEDVLSNLYAIAKGILFENDVTEVREKYAYVEIIFKEKYNVPIHVLWSDTREIPSSRVLFVLSGGPPDGYRGSVFFRSAEPSPSDNSFMWGWFTVGPSDQTCWLIFQDLINTVNEIQGVLSFSC